MFGQKYQNRLRAKSAITFDEFKNKVDEVFEFGNDWGLYVEIDKNYNHFMENKINKNKYKLFSIIENNIEEDDINYDTYDTYETNQNISNYFNNIKNCVKHLFCCAICLTVVLIFTK